MDAHPYRIDVRVASLDGLYSALDPSPFRQRDLDPRAVEHIVQWASDAPPKVPIERLGFDGWLLKDRLRLYRRLADMRVAIMPA